MTALKDWLVSFGMIVIKPLPSTFSKEATKDSGKFPWVFLWLEILVFTNTLDLILHFWNTYSPLSFFLMFILIPISFLFFVFWIDRIYLKLFHRKQDRYIELVYIITAILFPICGILSPLASLLPTAGTSIAYILYLYAIILIVIAVKAITRISYIKAVVTVFLSLVLTAACFLFLTVLVANFINPLSRVF